MGSLAQTHLPTVPDYYADHPKLLRQIILILNQIMAGKTTNTSSITLTANSATTVVSLPKGDLGQDTLIFFMPQTANAATEFGAGSMYVSSRDVIANPPTFTITHVNNAQTDRTFGFVLIG